MTQNAAQDGLHLIDGKFLSNAVAKDNRERGRERGGREEFILYWSSNYVEDHNVFHDGTFTERLYITKYIQSHVHTMFLNER